MLWCAGCGLSASYTSLLTWLLSLVPDHFGFLWGSGPPPGPRDTEGVAPFHVLGLQQMVLEGQLALHIAVTPVEGAAHGVGQGKATRKVKVGLHWPCLPKSSPAKYFGPLLCMHSGIGILKFNRAMATYRGVLSNHLWLGIEQTNSVGDMANNNL